MTDVAARPAPDPGSSSGSGVDPAAVGGAGRFGFTHVPALDGLRGAAVAAVLVYHLGHLTGGYLGVDLFFVLSGFLITSLLLAEHAAEDEVALADFWSRRVRRLMPALLVLLVVLAQEGKGGGLSGAFGGAGAETFGVKAGTVNAFTSWIAVAFLGLALLYAGLSSASKTDLESGSGVSTDQFTGSSGASDAAATDATDESAAGTTDGASDENTTPPDDAVDNGGDGDGDPDNGGNGGN